MSTETVTAAPFEASSRSREAQIEVLNWDFAKLSPSERIVKAHQHFAGRLMLATSFKPTAPVLIETATDVVPDIPVVTVRHGHETPETLKLAKWYEQERGLDIRVYEAPLLPVPPEEETEFKEFQRQAKVEPFQRAIEDIRPLAYLSGIMRWQSKARGSTPFVQDRGSVVLINPLADMSKKAVASFFETSNLPVDENYYDPAKGQHQQLECQLNTTAYA